MFDIRTGQVVQNPVIRFGDDEDSMVFLKLERFQEFSEDDEEFDMTPFETTTVFVTDIENQVVAEIRNKQAAERIKLAIEHALSEGWWQE